MTPDRRRFLQFLAASPLAAQLLPQDLLAQVGGSYPPGAIDVKAAKDALSVMDFEPLAFKGLSPGHWGYMAGGVEDDKTLKANRAAMDHYELRARRLVDVSKADLSLDVYGAKWDMPIYVSAVGGQRAFHPEGELATARAAKNKKTMQMLSTVASVTVEDVTKALGTAPWYQLYMPTNWTDTEKMVKRVEATGCPAICWTIDLLPGRNAETTARFARSDSRDCMTCHAAHPITGNQTVRNRTRPMFAGLEGSMNPSEATWSYVDRLKKMTSMKVLLKGIDTAEDALLAREHGADGVIVSNHGGRALETNRGTMDILPEVVDAVGRTMPVFVDGGFRRGSDIYKALAIGAKAVGIGRPYIWGLISFGQDGVERVLDILRAELTLTMRQMGTPTVAQITRAAVLRNGMKL